MIFNANSSVDVSHVRMAEGYDCSYGCALGLIESARNDYKMFRAMLDVDAREMQIQRESAGYVTEGQLIALAESTASSIWTKIKEIFKKLAEKIKAIFHTFMAKINTLWMKDKDLIKKYSKELYRKSNLGNLEVKWMKVTDGWKDVAPGETISFNKGDEFTDSTAKSVFGASKDDWDDSDRKSDVSNKKNYGNYKKDSDDRHDYFCPKISNKKVSYDSLEEDLDNYYLDGGEPSTEELKDVGGIRAIIQYLDGYSKNLKELKRTTDQAVKRADSLAKQADKYATESNKSDKFKDANGTAFTKDSDNYKKADVTATIATRAHEMAVAYQDVQLKVVNWILSADKRIYAQYKAAFVKAIGANNEKLEATYLEAVAEAAEQEVEDVIGAALSKEELSKINNASLNVMDSDVSNDPDSLTYGPDYYTDNQSYVRTAGTIDTDIASRNENAYFSQLIY